MGHSSAHTAIPWPAGLCSTKHQAPSTPLACRRVNVTRRVRSAGAFSSSPVAVDALGSTHAASSHLCDVVRARRRPCRHGSADETPHHP